MSTNQYKAEDLSMANFELAHNGDHFQPGCTPFSCFDPVTNPQSNVYKGGEIQTTQQDQAMRLLQRAAVALNV